MKQKQIKGLAIVGVAGAMLSASLLAVGNNVSVMVNAATSVNVTKVANQNIAGGWGLGIAVEFSPTLNCAYWKPIAGGNKVHLKNPFGVEQDITIEEVGQQLCINRNGGTNYKGYTVTFEQGWEFSDSNSNEYQLAQTAKFVCEQENGTTGAYWTDMYTPEITNIPTSTYEFGVGGAYTLSPVATDHPKAVFSYKSSDESVLTVNSAGKVSAVGLGEASITIYCCEVTKVVNFKVIENAQPQTGIKVKTKEIHTYQGFDFDISKLDVVEMYGENEGSQVDVTKEMISGTYDYNTIGSYTLTVTSKGFSDTFTLVVDELPEATIGTTAEYDFGAKSPWNTQFFFMTNVPDTAHYLNLHGEAEAQVKDHMTLNGSKDFVSSIKNLGGGRYEFWFKSGINLKAGDVLEVLSGMCIYQFTGTVNSLNHEPDLSTGKYVPVAQIKQNYKFVKTSDSWAIYAGEPTDMTFTGPSMISIGEELPTQVVILPEGTYGTPTYTSSNTSVATVKANGRITGVSEGEVTITATLGTIVKTIKVTVLPQKEIKTVRIVGTPNYYSVLLDSDPSEFKPNLSKAQIVFTDDTTGPVFDISESDVTLGTLDTSVEGDVDLPVRVAYKGQVYDGTIAVKVYSYFDQKISEVAIVDWFLYSTFLQLPNTCSNVANLTGGASMLPGLYSGIKYQRADGTNIDLKIIYQLGTNIAIFPEFLWDENNNPRINADNYLDYYLVGDTITIEADTPIYKWTGGIAPTATDNNALDAGTGEIIVEGFIKQKLTYKYDGMLWGLYVPYEDIAVANTELELTIGETKSVGATRVPNNATSGKFTYVSSNPNVATVNSGGVIKAVSEGEATITVTLSETGKESKSATIKVTVKDAITGISFPNKIQVALGTEVDKIDLSKVEATFVWASGKDGAKVDLTGATIAGYNKDKLGEQKVVITVTVDGQKYSGRAVIEVVEEVVTEPTNEGGNTNVGLIVGLSVGGAAIVAGGVVAFILIKKRKH